MGGQICTQRIPRVHTFDILARGGGHGGSTETEHPLFYNIIVTIIVVLFFSSVKIVLVAAEELGPNYSSRTREVGLWKRRVVAEDIS